MRGGGNLPSTVDELTAFGNHETRSAGFRIIADGFYPSAQGIQPAFWFLSSTICHSAQCGVYYPLQPHAYPSDSILTLIDQFASQQASYRSSQLQ